MKTCRAPQLLKSNGCKKWVNRPTIAWGANLLTLGAVYKANGSGLTFWSPPLVRIDRHTFTRWANFLTLRAYLETRWPFDTFRGPPKLGVEGLTLAWSAQRLAGWTELETHGLIRLDTVWRPVVVLQCNKYKNDNDNSIIMSRRVTADVCTTEAL